MTAQSSSGPTSSPPKGKVTQALSKKGKVTQGGSTAVYVDKSGNVIGKSSMTWKLIKG